MGSLKPGKFKSVYIRVFMCHVALPFPQSSCWPLWYLILWVLSGLPGKIFLSRVNFCYMKS